MPFQRGSEHLITKRNSERKFSDEQIQVIYGSVLGDGSLGKPKTGINYHLTVAHGEKQVEYLRWKHGLLSPLSSEIACHRRFDGRYGRTYSTWRFHTPSIPFLTDLHSECYPCGIKRMPRSLLERLGPLGMAVWFMDDGSVSCGAPSIATVCFPREDVIGACNWMGERWGIPAHPSLDNRICVALEGRPILRGVIETFIIPSMQYKVPPDHYRRKSN